MKHDLPNEWHLLQQTGSVDLIIDKSRLPYMAQSLNAAIESLMFVIKDKDNPVSPVFTINANGTATNLTWNDKLKLYTGINSDIDLDSSFILSISNVDKDEVEELISIFESSLNPTSP